MPPVFQADTIIFDLDGTLVDSVPDLAIAVDRMCAELDLPERGADRVRDWVGNGMRMLVARALAGGPEVVHDDATIDAAFEVYKGHYADSCCMASKPYPAADETLRTLKEKGYNLALATNKHSKFTEKVLEHFGWSDLFDLVLSYDSLPQAKPHPLPLLHAVETLGSSAVMVGDSATDVLAARRAKMPVIATSYGYNHGEPIERSAPDVVIDGLDQLPCHLASQVHNI